MTSRFSKDVADIRLQSKVLPPHSRTAPVNVSGKENSLPQQLCSYLRCASEPPLESFSLVTVYDIHLGLDEEEGKKEEREEKSRKMLKNLLVNIYTLRHPNLSEQKKDIQAHHKNDVGSLCK